jgi:hypothetical protein
MCRVEWEQQLVTAPQWAQAQASVKPHLLARQSVQAERLMPQEGMLPSQMLAVLLLARLERPLLQAAR